MRALMSHFPSDGVIWVAATVQLRHLDELASLRLRLPSTSLLVSPFAVWLCQGSPLPPTGER
jgi:hypothetical protein